MGSTPEDSTIDKGDKNEKNKLEIRYFYDSIEEEQHYFYSDAKQSSVDSFDFVGFWWDVKRCLEKFGYTVIEIELENNN